MRRVLAKTVYRTVRQPEPLPYPVWSDDYYALTLVGQKGLFGKGWDKKVCLVKELCLRSSGLRYLRYSEEQWEKP